MVWSSAARNIVSSRLIRMVRTSRCVSGAIDGASAIAIMGAGSSVSSLAIASGNASWSAG
jgi:hypothetical protein